MWPKGKLSQGISQKVEGLSHEMWKCVSLIVEGGLRYYLMESGREVEVIVLNDFIKVENYSLTIPNILQKGW